MHGGTFFMIACALPTVPSQQQSPIAPPPQDAVPPNAENDDDNDDDDDEGARAGMSSFILLLLLISLPLGGNTYMTSSARMILPSLCPFLHIE